MERPPTLDSLYPVAASTPLPDPYRPGDVSNVLEILNQPPACTHQRTARCFCRFAALNPDGTISPSKLPRSAYKQRILSTKLLPNHQTHKTDQPLLTSSTRKQTADRAARTVGAVGQQIPAVSNHQRVSSSTGNDRERQQLRAA